MQVGFNSPINDYEFLFVCVDSESMFELMFESIFDFMLECLNLCFSLCFISCLNPCYNLCFSLCLSVYSNLYVWVHVWVLQSMYECIFECMFQFWVPISVSMASFIRVMTFQFEFGFLRNGVCVVELMYAIVIEKKSHSSNKFYPHLAFLPTNSGTT